MVAELWCWRNECVPLWLTHLFCFYDALKSRAKRPFDGAQVTHLDIDYGNILLSLLRTLSRGVPLPVSGVGPTLG